MRRSRLFFSGLDMPARDWSFYDGFFYLGLGDFPLLDLFNFDLFNFEFSDYRLHGFRFDYFRLWHLGLGNFGLCYFWFWCRFGHGRIGDSGDIGIVVVIVVAGDVTGLIRLLFLGLKFRNHAFLKHLAAFGVNWVSDIGVEFSATVVIALSAIFFESRSALIAVLRAEMVLVTALSAMESQLPAGHRDKRTVGTLDDLQVPYDKTIIQRD